MDEQKSKHRPTSRPTGNRMRPQGVSASSGASSANPKEKMNLEDIVHIANKVGLEYAKAKREAEHLDLLKATKRAKAMLKHDDGKMSEAKIKRLAETDEEYVEFLIELSDKKSEAEKLRIRYESYKNLFEARRSMLSYQKAEMKLL
jgi:hypothetical protein